MSTGTDDAVAPPPTHQRYLGNVLLGLGIGFLCSWYVHPTLFCALGYFDLPEVLAILLRAIEPFWLLMIFIPFPAALAMFVLGAYSVYQRQWPRVIRCFVALFVIGSALPLRVGQLSDMARDVGIDHAIQRGQPIITALEKYHADHGNYPPNLAALTPQYLSEIPTTGMACYPTFRYYLPPVDRTLNTFTAFQLCVYMRPFFDLDKLCYRPPGNNRNPLEGNWVFSDGRNPLDQQQVGRRTRTRAK